MKSKENYVRVLFQETPEKRPNTLLAYNLCMNLKSEKGASDLGRNSARAH